MNRTIDHQVCRTFGECGQNEMASDLDFHKKIFFRDEAHFCLNEYVNKQNCRIWSDHNPAAIVKAFLNTQKVTDWCAKWAEAIIATYFFKNEAIMLQSMVNSRES